MANELSKESSLFPSNDGEREDSGLQDILSVAAKINDDEPAAEDGDPGGEDSGLILFSAGTDTNKSDEGDDALFGSFAGGLGAGFAPAADPPASSAADLTPLAGEGRVSEARPAEAKAAPPPQESKRSPLVAVAVVLGLALAGTAAVLLTNRDGGDQTEQQAQAGMSAPEDEAAVGKADEPTPEAVDSAAGSGAAPEPEPEPVLEDDPELAIGETDGLPTSETEGDPLGVREGLLESDGTNGVKKLGKWDQGTSYAKPEAETPPPSEPKDDDDDPLPLPEPKPKKPSISDPTSDEEVDCLLNPDLPKCAGGSKPKPKETEILAPKVPDKLSSSQLREGFNGIKSTAKKCGQQNGAPPGTSVKVHVSIEGATGTVQSVSATGEYAGTPLGKCVEDAVKGAQFEIFKKPAMGVDYPIVM